MISVLVVSHNSRQLLSFCLERLVEQGDEHAEVIVVDNASNDGSVELVQREFPQMRLLALDTNLGFGAANNRAAALAKGEYLLLLNSDAWLAAGSLTQLCLALDRDPRLGLVAPQLHYPDHSLQFTWVPDTGAVGEAVQMIRNRFEDRPWNHRWMPPLLRLFLGPGWYSAACVLVRKRAFEDVSGFDENIFLYFEDVDLCRRLRRHGWRLAQDRQAQAFHVKGGSQRSGSSEVEYRRAQLYYYRKHRPAWENALLRRKLRRKFARQPNPQLRRRLLEVLEA